MIAKVLHQVKQVSNDEIGIPLKRPSICSALLSLHHLHHFNMRLQFYCLQVLLGVLHERVQVLDPVVSLLLHPLDYKLVVQWCTHLLCRAVLEQVKLNLGAFYFFQNSTLDCLINLS